MACFFLSIFSFLHSEGEEQLSPDAIFLRIPNPNPGPDKYNYYIKPNYYTQENIEAGKIFFETNCAVCHGTEADGSGTRASAMKEAKPRMLTNIDWNLSRDDLRLLRSIKYGVAGTAMTPWGDQTSSLQRLQLVIFIRSLSRERKYKEELSSELYQTYEPSLLAVENARIHEYEALSKTKQQYENLRKERVALYEKFEADSAAPPQKALEIYQKEINALAELKKKQENDASLATLMVQISQEKDKYNEVGMNLLNEYEEENFQKFLKIVQLNAGRFQYINEQLKADFNPENEKKIALIGQEIIENLDKRIQEKKEERIRTEGKIVSSERNENLASINTALDAIHKIKVGFIEGVEEAARLREKQQMLYQSLSVK